MTYSLLSGLVIFCFVSSITPGPNNLMLMATGANFGARRAAPHASGIVLGFTFMIIAIGLGVAVWISSRCAWGNALPQANQTMGQQVDLPPAKACVALALSVLSQDEKKSAL